ncbi:MAG: maleylpyruvate isomerase family mycothiol-dependent enzyme [Gordonia sp. (in: high G+C Gram-positive bacteria)]
MSYPELTLVERLAIARTGTTHFARLLAAIPDAELDRPSLLPGWTRKHLVAHVGYNAAALTRLLEWAATGVEVPMYPSANARDEEIDSGATLPAHALRNLFDHTAARLDEKWRNLSDDRWDFPVTTIQGRTLPVSETAWLRTREVWIHAVDLANGGTFADIPHPALTGLISDVRGAWRRTGNGSQLRLIIDGETLDIAPEFDGKRIEISGPTAAVTRWICGRGDEGVHVSQTDILPPRWL